MEHLLRFITILFIYICGGITSSYSQTAILRGLTAKEGLSGSIVYAIYKDSRGFVWLASDKGVDRFDGYHIKPCNGFSGTAVKTLTELKDGTILAGNQAGLWKYNDTKGTFEAAFRRNVNAGVSVLLTDSQGRLYAGTTKGIYLLERNQWQQFLPDRNVFSRNNHIQGMTTDENGRLWFVCETGVYSLDPATKKTRLFLQGEPRFYNCIACFRGKVYIGTRNKGILCYDAHSGKKEPLANIGASAVKTLAVDPSRQMLYAGTDGSGVFFLSTATGQLIKELRSEAGIENTLRSNSVYSLLPDKEGGLWVGYFQMGLDYTLYQNHLFSLYNFPAALFNSYHIPVRAIAIHDNQRVIGSRDGLYFIDEGRRLYRHYTSPQLASNMIFCITYYQHTYLIGTPTGLYRLDPENGNLQMCTLPGTKGKDELFFSLMSAKDGSLWLGTSTGLFRYRNGQPLEHFQTTNSQLPGNIIYRIYEDSEKCVWLVTDNGICIYEPSTKTIRTDLFPPAFPWKDIRNVCESRSGTLYFVTARGTLLASSPDLKNTKPFLPELFADGKKCSFMTEDNKGGLWLGTDNGLFCKDSRGRLHTYTFIDGIPDPVFFSCQPVTDARGQLWLGNSQGLLKWNGQYEATPLPYKLRVTDVLVNNRSLGNEAFEGNGIRLSSSKDELTFQISDLSYTEPSSVAYEYCLEGQDNGWKLLRGSSELTYYNLSSGSYTLKIRIAGIPSSEVDIPVSIGLSWWLLVLGIGVAGFIVIRIFCLWQKKHLWKSVKALWSRRKEQAVEPAGAISEKYRNNKVDEESCVLLAQKLDYLMREKKMYLNPDLKLKDIADKIGVPVYNLSYVLNIYMHQRFNDYVNNFRVEEFKALVTDAKYRLYTLDALSSLCGFSSKTSFFRNFKRIEEITPNEYIRQLESKG